MNLNQLVPSYLSALMQRDPTALSLAPTCRFTENGQELQLGDGLWGTASALGLYQHPVVDAITGQAGFVGIVYENGHPVILALRVATDGTQITEIESIVSRDDILFYRGGTDNLEAMQSPLTLWSQVLTAGARRSRAEMIAIADSYFAALERNDGLRTAPIAPSCRRMDNGVYATQNPSFDKPDEPPFYALGPAEQLKLGYFNFVTAIRDRRFPVVDLERGVVFSLAFFDHAGTIHEAKLTDGRTVPIAVKRPFSWQIAELFKIESGQITQIEVVLNQAPYRMRPNWPS